MVTISGQRGSLIPAEPTGRWIAWDRQQTQVVATGNTFDEAKQAAAKAGHCAILLAKADSPRNAACPGHRPPYMVAVFASQGKDL